MSNIPLIALVISSLLSVVAIIISGLGLLNSRRALQKSQDAQHHTQIVTFEQRKQEVRQIIFECGILLIEVDTELNRLKDSEYIREKIAWVDGVRRQTETNWKNFDAIPTSPSTEARINLEQIGGIASEVNNSIQALLKILHNYK